MEKISLYDLVGMKRKNSVLKSVFINSNKREAYSLCSIDVEAYDDTFLNATKYPSLQDKTYDTITNAIIKYQDKIKEYINDYSDEIEVMHYSTFDRFFQDLVLFKESDRIAKKEWLEKNIKSLDNR